MKASLVLLPLVWGALAWAQPAGIFTAVGNLITALFGHTATLVSLG